jgi:uncharacterized paraquat-inducible protein A
MKRSVRCPDCGATIDLPEDLASGGIVECPNCAGHGLRVWESNGAWSARLAYRVSCPGCNTIVTLPEDAKAGDTIDCCGRTYRLTFEFGAFAAETR